MTDALAARHSAAEEIAAAAAALALGFFHRRTDLVTETKASPQDIVSRADREVEALIRARVAALFPDDGFLGEEMGVQAGTSGFTWVIDPIDGTSPFMAGLPHWCVAIAVQQGADTMAAVTHVPLADEVFSVRRDAGVRLNGAPLRLGDAARLTNSQTGIGASHRSRPAAMAALIGALLEAGGVFYRNGSGALMLASVAGGRLGSYHEAHMNAWDCLGGLLMVREAGGMTAPFCAGGDLLAGGAVTAAAPQVWPDLLAVLDAAQG